MLCLFFILSQENLVPPRTSTCALPSEIPSFTPSSAHSQAPSDLQLPSSTPSLAPSAVASMNYNPSRMLFPDLEDFDTFEMLPNDSFETWQPPSTTKKQTYTKRHRKNVILRP